MRRATTALASYCFRNGRSIRHMPPNRRSKCYKVYSCNWNDICVGSVLPDSCKGAVEVQHVSIQGRGRGVVAKEDVPVGSVIMICTPLVFASDVEGTIPDMDELLQQLQSTALPLHQIAKLKGLTNGYESDDLQPSGLQNADILQNVEYKELGLDNMECSSRMLSFEEMNMEQREGAISLNMFGEESQDMTLTLARGGTPQGHLGLWLDFSMFNHSCWGNAVHFTVEDSVVVRAARRIQKGEEVCINYLGRGSLAPVDRRLEVLQDTLGFKCSCPRCAYELNGGASISSAIQGFMEEAVQKLGPTLEVAAQARDIEEIQACADRLRIMTLSLHDLIGSVNSPSSSSQPSEAKAWLQASAYELYSAYCTCLELLYSWSLEDATSSSLNPKLTQVNKDLTEDKDSCGMSLTFTSTTAEFNAALTQLHSVVSNSSPVSDLHLLLSVKRWSLQQQWLEAKFPFFEKKNDMMSQTSEMDEMKRGVCEILQARYGPVSPDVLIRLINASSRALDLVQI